MTEATQAGKPARKPISPLRKLTSQLDDVVARLETNKAKSAKLQVLINKDLELFKSLLTEIEALRNKPL